MIIETKDLSFKKDYKYPIISTVMFIITIIINYVGNTGIFGYTQKEISDMYRNFMTPEPFAFSIWGIIYALIAAFLIYQFYISSKSRYSPQVLDKLNIYFILTCVFNILWNITWLSNRIAISTVLIFIFTIILGLINTHILKMPRNIYSKLIPIAFATYFGWLTVATVTNVSAYLVSIKWDMFGINEHIITCLVYIVIGLLAGLIISRIRNPIYNLPIIWAFVGVMDMLLNNPPKSPIHPGMPFVVGGVMILLLVEAVLVFIKNDKDILPRVLRAQ